MLMAKSLLGNGNATCHVTSKQGSVRNTCRHMYFEFPRPYCYSDFYETTMTIEGRF